MEKTTVAAPAARILRDNGRAVVLALDHARSNGVIEGIEDPGAMLEAVAHVGVDAVLCNYGAAKRYRDLLDPDIPIVLRADGGESIYRTDWLNYRQWRQLYTVEDARAVGAEAVVTMVFMGSHAELDTLEVTAKTASEAHRRELPIMVEALPCRGERVLDPLDPDAMADAARLAFEHGADLIKNYYVGDVEGYRRSTEATPLATLVAGGKRMSTTRDVLQTVADALEAGGAGAVVGRNVWQHPDPPGMAKALIALVHDGASVDEALTLVRAGT